MVVSRASFFRPAVQTTLKLTDDQKKELEVIQKEVDARLEKSADRRAGTQLKEMRDRQPNRGGQPGGGRGNGRSRRRTTEAGQPKIRMFTARKTCVPVFIQLTLFARQCP